jgi:hypothetical protein
MFFGHEDMHKKFEQVATFFAVEDFIEPAPNYIQGPNWTDELREKHGWEKQPDGSWGRLMTSMSVYNQLRKDVEDLYENYRQMCDRAETLRKTNEELEYACRVAARAVAKISKTTGENV